MFPYAPSGDGQVWQCCRCDAYYKVAKGKDKYDHPVIRCWIPATKQEHATYIGLKELSEFSFQRIADRVGYTKALNRFS